LPFSNRLKTTLIRMVIEEHGASKLLVRFRVWPRATGMAKFVGAMLIFLAPLAAMNFEAVTAVVLGGATVLAGTRTVWESASSLATTISVFEEGSMEQDVPFTFPDREHAQPLHGRDVGTPIGHQ